MLTIVKGAVLNARVMLSFQPGIEHGLLRLVRAIIVHQTDSEKASQTLSGYAAGAGASGNGAHFLIDKDGTIYQTAHLDKVCWQIGKIKALCYEKHNCVGDEKKFFDALDAWSRKGHYADLVSKGYQHEVKTKKYPARYPTNEESLGIELVGKKLGPAQDSPFELVTKEQQESLTWLIGELLTSLSLKRTDIYRHPEVSRKSTQEAISAKF